MIIIVKFTVTSLIGEKIETRCQKIHDALLKKYKLVGEDADLLEKNRKKLTTAYYRKCRSYLPRIKVTIFRAIILFILYNYLSNILNHAYQSLNTVTLANILITYLNESFHIF